MEDRRKKCPSMTGSGRQPVFINIKERADDITKISVNGKSTSLGDASRNGLVVGPIFGSDGRMAGVELVEDHADLVKVSPIGGVAQQGARAHVKLAADAGIGGQTGVGGVAQVLGDAKVRDLDDDAFGAGAGAGVKDVVELDVAVDHAAQVDVLQARQQLAGHFHHHSGRHAVVGQRLDVGGQRAGRLLHHQPEEAVVGEGVVQADDVGVVERHHQPRFFAPVALHFVLRFEGLGGFQHVGLPVDVAAQQRDAERPFSQRLVRRVQHPCRRRVDLLSLLRQRDRRCVKPVRCGRRCGGCCRCYDRGH